MQVHFSSLYKQEKETSRREKQNTTVNQQQKKRPTVWQSTSLKTLVVQMKNMMEAAGTE